MPVLRVELELAQAPAPSHCHQLLQVCKAELAAGRAMLAEVLMAGRAGALQGSPAWRAHLAALRRIYLVAAVVWQATQRMALADALARDVLQAAWQACEGAWGGQPATVGAPALLRKPDLHNISVRDMAAALTTTLTGAHGAERRRSVPSRCCRMCCRPAGRGCTGFAGYSATGAIPGRAVLGGWPVRNLPAAAVAAGQPADRGLGRQWPPVPGRLRAALAASRWQGVA